MAEYTREQLIALARQAAERHGLDPDVFVRQLAVESINFDPDVVSGRRASPAGAKGVAQFMDATAQGMGVDPLNPPQAIDGAARLMAGYLRQYGRYDLALAAYNAGPGAVQKYGGVPPYQETRTYIQKIMGQGSQAQARGSGKPPGLGSPERGDSTMYTSGSVLPKTLTARELEELARAHGGYKREITQPQTAKDVASGAASRVTFEFQDGTSLEVTWSQDSGAWVVGDWGTVGKEQAKQETTATNGVKTQRVEYSDGSVAHIATENGPNSPGVGKAVWWERGSYTPEERAAQQPKKQYRYETRNGQTYRIDPDTNRAEPVEGIPADQSATRPQFVNHGGSVYRVDANGNLTQALAPEPPRLSPAELAKAKSDELWERVGRKELTPQEAITSFDEWWRVNVDLPLARHRIGQDTVDQYLKTLPYRVGPGFGAKAAQAVNAIGGQGQAPNWEAADFTFPMADVGQMADEAIRKLMGELGAGAGAAGASAPAPAPGTAPGATPPPVPAGASATPGYQTPPLPVGGAAQAAPGGPVAAGASAVPTNPNELMGLMIRQYRSPRPTLNFSR